MAYPGREAWIFRPRGAGGLVIDWNPPRTLLAPAPASRTPPSGWTDLSEPVDLNRPLDDHWANQGLVCNLLALPWTSGRRWHDLTRAGPGRYDATLSGVAFPATATSGWHGTSRPGGMGELRLDRVDDYAAVASSPTLSPARLTVTAWVRFRTADPDQYVVSKEESSSPFGWGLRINGLGNLDFFVGAATSAALAGTPSVGVWHHLAGTYDGATIRLYVDGRLAASAGMTSGVPSNSARLCVGRSDAFGRFLGGAVDDVRVYSRVLSALQLAAAYDLSRRGDPGRLRRLESPVFNAIVTAPPLRVSGNGDRVGLKVSGSGDYVGRVVRGGGDYVGLKVTGVGDEL